MRLDKLLSQIYYDPGSQGSLSSPYQLYLAAKRKGVVVKLSQVRDWCSTQRPYAIHRRVLQKYRGNRVEVSGIREQFQIDLADFSQYANVFNKKVRYILVCIDVFSKMGYVEPLARKTSAATAKAMDVILQKAGVPKRIMSDRGREFNAKEFHDLMRRHNIHHIFLTNPNRKAVVAERFIQTLRGRIRRLIESRGKRKYIDALQKVVDGYNNSYHRMIRRRPIDVNEENEADVWLDLYGDKPCAVGQKPKYRYEVGDFVLIAQSHFHLGKGIKRFADEIFRVRERRYEYVPTYYVEDLDGHLVQGFFYEPELQKVAKV